MDIGSSNPFGRAYAAFVSLIFVLYILGSCGAKEDGEERLDNLFLDKLPGWKADQPTRTYDRRTIFDYMDGAGEIYLLYDFLGLMIGRFSNSEGFQVTVEFFDMGKPQDAFGIFTHSRQGSEAGFGQGSEYRGGLLCFWKNRYFVCITAEKMTEEIEEHIGRLARIIADRIETDGELPAILSCLPENGLIESSIIYFHNQASLNYHYYLSEQNILNLTDDTDCLLARYEPDKPYLLCVIYDSPSRAEESLQSFLDGYMPEGKENGLTQTAENQWIKALAEDNLVIIVLDAANSDRASELAEAALSKIRKSVK